jgi:hypothetical protein
MQEPEVERTEHQDDANVRRQALPEVVSEDQDVHPDHTAAIATAYNAPVVSLPMDPPDPQRLSA